MRGAAKGHYKSALKRKLQKFTQRASILRVDPNKYFNIAALKREQEAHGMASASIHMNAANSTPKLSKARSRAPALMQSTESNLNSSSTLENRTSRLLGLNPDLSSSTSQSSDEETPRPKRKIARRQPDSDESDENQLESSQSKVLRGNQDRHSVMMDLGGLHKSASATTSNSQEKASRRRKTEAPASMSLRPSRIQTNQPPVTHFDPSLIQNKYQISGQIDENDIELEESFRK